MEWASKDLVGLIYHLLPGFLAAWVFHGLTAHPRRDTFDRVVQALIFTIIVQSLAPLGRRIWWSFHTAGSYWTDSKAVAASTLTAVLVGLLFAAAANSDWVHWLLRKARITKRTSYPSEWYSAFHSNDRYVVLHLSGDRRLRGWAKDWPDQPEKGHFVIAQPEWLLDDGQEIPVFQVHEMLIPVTEIGMVEFVKRRVEVAESEEYASGIQQPLFALHKEKKNGSQGTPTGTSAVSDAPDDNNPAGPDRGPRVNDSSATADQREPARHTTAPAS